MKLCRLLIMIALFSACINQAGCNKVGGLQDSISCDRDDSGDGREGHDSVFSSSHGNVYCLTRNDGSKYYIVNRSEKVSSKDGYAWLEAYEMTGDKAKRVNVVDGSSPFEDDYRFSVNYDIPSWYYATKGAGYDWILEYDSLTNELFVPVTTDDHAITDRYNVWRFDGEGFFYEGIRHNRHLNSCLSQYDRLLKYIKTKDYTVRVDILANGDLRYSSWRKPCSMEDSPDIVLTHGRAVCHDAHDQTQPCEDYRFKNGSYEYIVNYCEVIQDDDGDFVHHDYLMVRRGSKVLLKQEIE